MSRHIRQPTATTPTGSTWADVLVDGLTYPAETYDMITIYCLNSSQSLVSSQSANHTGGGAGYRTPTKRFYGLSPETTYLFYADVRYLPANSIVRIPDSGFLYVTTLPEGPVRPGNYSWPFSKSAGGDFYLGAFEWNAFFARINEFRAYKNLGAYTYTTAYSGLDFYAYIFNQAVYAISAMSPTYSPPSIVSSGNTVYASQLNQLVTSLNSVS